MVFDFAEHIWNLMNIWLGDQPAAIVLSLFIMFIIVRLIPHIWKWRRGELKKEHEERKTILTTVTTNTKELKKIGYYLSIMNGTIATHISNISIHTPKEEFVTKELFTERTTNMMNAIEALFNKTAGI